MQLKLRSLLFFAGSILFAVELSASEVSIRLRPLKGSISISGSDIKVMSSEKSTSISTSQSSPRDPRGPLFERKGFDRFRFQFSRGSNGAIWKISNPADEVVLATINGEKVAIFGDGLRVDLRPAPSHVELVAKPRTDKRGSMSLVGFFSIEEYLEGVVASEMPGDWPIEALKAQAIAARSFAVAKVRERSLTNRDWLLESNVTDQVFDYERAHSRAIDAVKTTRGEVLTSSAGFVVAANYHSDCGGQTDEARAIWGGGIRTGTAIDSACSTKRSPWRFVKSLSDLQTAMSLGRLIPSGFRLATIAVVGRSESGRALNLRAKSLEGETRILSGERLRAVLGYGELKSTLFQVKPIGSGESTQIEFVGRGFGHGTGLCQWGARELAQNGKSYREILQHYYPLLALARAGSGSGIEPGAASGHRGVSPGANASP